MKARVIHNGSIISDKKEFPDDLEIGAQIDWTLARGAARTSIKLYVTRITPVVLRGGITHEVEVGSAEEATYTQHTRMALETVPETSNLMASDFMQMVMLVNDRILEGKATPEILGLQGRLNALIPYVLHEGNPTAVEIIKDI